MDEHVAVGVCELELEVGGVVEGGWVGGFEGEVGGEGVQALGEGVVG